MEKVSELRLFLCTVAPRVHFCYGIHILLMYISTKISIVIVLIVGFFLGYLLLVRSPREVRAPSEFMGPSGEPTTEGPMGLPPEH